MNDYLMIGSSPCEEECAQVGSPDYRTRAMKELTAFKNQLLRVFGTPPIAANLVIKSFPHDFGTYHEVCVIYDDENEEAVDYAFKLEANTPMVWDDIAKKELK